MKLTLKILLAVFLFVPSIFAVHGAPAGKLRLIQDGWAQYSEKIRPLPVVSSALIPWPKNMRVSSIFYDGFFLKGDDSRLLITILKDDYSKAKFNHEAEFFIYDSTSRSWKNIGSEFLQQDYRIIPVRATPEWFIFAKQAGEDSDYGEIVTYDMKTMARTSKIITGKQGYKKIITAGSAEICGLSREFRPGDPSQFIAASRINTGTSYYKGIVSVRGRNLEQTEVLRFGSEPQYLTGTRAITFRFREYTGSFFGFYDTAASGPIYSLKADNMIFSHYEQGVRVKQYVNIIKLRAINASFDKMVFLAEDEAGPRVVLLNIQPALFGP
jgi:hypothetical protein